MVMCHVVLLPFFRWKTTHTDICNCKGENEEFTHVPVLQDDILPNGTESKTAESVYIDQNNLKMFPEMSKLTLLRRILPTFL
jgi:hypothetical protein